MHSCQSLLPDCQIRQNGQKDLRSAKILFSQMQKIASLNFCTPPNRFCRIAKSGRMVRKTSGVRKFYFRKCKKPLRSMNVFFLFLDFILPTWGIVGHIT